MGEICERSERATENKKKRLGGNFKFSGCGALQMLTIVERVRSKLEIIRLRVHPLLCCLMPTLGLSEKRAVQYTSC